MSLTVNWSEIGSWSLAVLVFFVALVFVGFFVAWWGAVVFAVGDGGWRSLRWMRRAKRILQAENDNYDRDGFRRYLGPDGEVWYQDGREPEGRLYLVGEWRREVICVGRPHLQYNGDGTWTFQLERMSPMFCDREGKPVKRLPDDLQRADAADYWPSTHPPEAA